MSYQIFAIVRSQRWCYLQEKEGTATSQVPMMKEYDKKLSLCRQHALFRLDKEHRTSRIEVRKFLKDNWCSVKLEKRRRS